MFCIFILLPAVVGPGVLVGSPVGSVKKNEVCSIIRKNVKKEVKFKWTR